MDARRVDCVWHTGLVNCADAVNRAVLARAMLADRLEHGEIAGFRGIDDLDLIARGGRKLRPLCPASFRSSFRARTSAKISARASPVRGRLRMKCSWPIRVRPTARSRSPASSVAGSSSASTARAATSRIGRFRRRPTSGFSSSMRMSGSRRSWRTKFATTLGEPTARRLLGLSPQPFHGPSDPPRAVAERSLPAAVSPRRGAVRRADRSCGSGTQQRHGRPAARAARSLHVHFVFAVLAEALAVCRRAGAALERGRPPAEACGSCCFGFRCGFSRLRAAAGFLGWAGRAASLRAGRVSLVVEASVSVAAAIGSRHARAGSSRFRSQ